MSEQSPNVVVVAGPNGSGKSTAAPALLRDYLGITEFVNADVIAQGLSGFAAENVAMQAGQRNHLEIHSGEVRMTEGNKNDHATVAQRLTDVEEVQHVLKQAARQAILEHKRAGQKVAVWRDNQVVWEEPTIEEEKAQ